MRWSRANMEIRVRKKGVGLVPEAGALLICDNGNSFKSRLGQLYYVQRLSVIALRVEWAREVRCVECGAVRQSSAHTHLDSTARELYGLREQLAINKQSWLNAECLWARISDWRNPSMRSRHFRRNQISLLLYLGT